MVQNAPYGVGGGTDASGAGNSGGADAMMLATTRFGLVSADTRQIIEFPAGLVGWHDQRRWLLLPDPEHPRVGWLQSVDRPELALPVISPRYWFPDYRVRIRRGQLPPGINAEKGPLLVLLVLRHGPEGWTANLRAPLLIDLSAGKGCQVVTCDEQPIAMPLPARTSFLRKTA